MSSLYELTQDFQTVMDMIDDGKTDGETLSNTLDCIDWEIEEKADGYAKVIRNIESDIAGLDTEIKRMQQKKAVLQNGITTMKENLYQAMITTDKRKFKTQLFSFTIQNNGGLRPLKIDSSVNEIPKEYLILQDPIPNNDAIRKLLETELPSWAHLEERGESLRIR